MTTSFLDNPASAFDTVSCTLLFSILPLTPLCIVPIVSYTIDSFGQYLDTRRRRVMGRVYRTIASSNSPAPIMGLNLPFPSPLSLPIPRRFVILGLSGIVVILFLHTFAPSALPPVLTPGLPHHEPDASWISSSKWLPHIFDYDAPDRPDEFDEEGMCLFLSPFDALTATEKARVEFLTLQEVSQGLVKSRAPLAPTDADPDYDDDFSAASNASRTSPAGLTHPILGLLRDGEIKWKDRMARQSKTIEQAVGLYQRKWGRPPPKGFDLWSVHRCFRIVIANPSIRWQFAQSNHVLLPDEYDAWVLSWEQEPLSSCSSVMDSLLPFYALPIATLQERMTEVESIQETFTLIVHDGKVVLQWNDDYSRDTWWASRPRADSQINLMEPFVGMIGNIRCAELSDAARQIS